MPPVGALPPEEAPSVAGVAGVAGVAEVVRPAEADAVADGVESDPGAPTGVDVAAGGIGASGALVAEPAVPRPLVVEDVDAPARDAGAFFAAVLFAAPGPELEDVTRVMALFDAPFVPLDEDVVDAVLFDAVLFDAVLFDAVLFDVDAFFAGDDDDVFDAALLAGDDDDVFFAAVLAGAFFAVDVDAALEVEAFFAGDDEDVFAVDFEAALVDAALLEADAFLAGDALAVDLDVVRFDADAFFAGDGEDVFAVDGDAVLFDAVLFDAVLFDADAFFAGDDEEAFDAALFDCAP